MVYTNCKTALADELITQDTRSCCITPLEPRKGMTLVMPPASRNSRALPLRCVIGPQRLTTPAHSNVLPPQQAQRLLGTPVLGTPAEAAGSQACDRHG